MSVIEFSNAARFGVNTAPLNIFPETYDIPFLIVQPDHVETMMSCRLVLLRSQVNQPPSMQTLCLGEHQFHMGLPDLLEFIDTMCDEIVRGMTKRGRDDDQGTEEQAEATENVRRVLKRARLKVGPLHGDVRRQLTKMLCGVVGVAGVVWLFNSIRIIDALSRVAGIEDWIKTHDAMKEPCAVVQGIFQVKFHRVDEARCAELSTSLAKQTTQIVWKTCVTLALSAGGLKLLTVYWNTVVQGMKNEFPKHIDQLKERMEKLADGVKERVYILYDEFKTKITDKPAPTAQNVDIVAAQAAVDAEDEDSEEDAAPGEEAAHATPTEANEDAAPGEDDAHATPAKANEESTYVKLAKAAKNNAENFANAAVHAASVASEAAEAAKAATRYAKGTQKVSKAAEASSEVAKAIKAAKDANEAAEKATEAAKVATEAASEDDGATELANNAVKYASQATENAKAADTAAKEASEAVNANNSGKGGGSKTNKNPNQGKPVSSRNTRASNRASTRDDEDVPI